VTDLGDKALLNDEVSDIERAVSTPTKPDKTLACLWMDKPILDEERRKHIDDLGEMRGSIDLFLSKRKQLTHKQQIQMNQKDKD